MLRRAGLGLLVGAVFRFPLAAQVGPPPPIPDTVRTQAVDDTSDSTRARRDSLADAALAPIARADAAGVEAAYRWTRDAIFVSGAQTVAELLELTPGVTVMRSGYISSPAAVSYLGDLARVRVFYDGLEMDPLNPRNSGVLDLIEVPLWSVEEVRLERGPGELRVHLRSWRIRSVVPVTRTDIYTGDEDTNLYRGFFGRRYVGGVGFQIGAQQYSTSSRRVTGGGDELSLLARAAWARDWWSVDGFVVRARRAREEQLRVGDRRVAPFEGARTDAYLRAAAGDPEHGAWVQLIAGSQEFKEETPGTAAPPPPDPDDPIPSADTIRSRAQYVATGGLTLAGIRLTGTNRMRVFEGNTFHDQSVRASLDRHRLGVSVFAERAQSDSTMRADAIARLQLTSFLWLGGAVGVQRDDDERTNAAEQTSFRGEVGIRFRELNASAGILSRDSTLLAPATVFDTAYGPGADGQANGIFGTANGRVWRDVFVRGNLTYWDDDGPYRPQLQTRGEIYLSTRWLSRFPSGNFGLLLSAVVDGRSETCFPFKDGTCEMAAPSQVINTVVELRILQAVLSWRFENIRASQYNLVPGYSMPRAVSLYGVRWEFRN